MSETPASARWQPYPAYKDSGVPWLREIPDHWQAMPLKRLCWRSAVYGANESAAGYSDQGVRFLRTTDIDDDGRLKSDGAVYLSPDLVNEYLLDDGDLLVSRSGTLGRSFVYRTEEHGPCAYAGYLVRFSFTPSMLPQFAFYFTKTRHFQDWMSVSVVESTIGNVNGQKYANMPLPVPSPREQRAIAAFLDRETAHIDALLVKKERLLELLAEKRTALISHAVTRGLDASAPLKESGVAWLGKIPVGWDTRPLKFSTLLINGAPFKPGEWGGEGTPIIRIENLNAGTDFNFTERKLDSKYYVRNGDLLFAWSGNRGTSFGPYVWQQEGLYYLNQHIFKVAGFRFDRKWFYWLLRGVTAYVESQAHGIIGLVHITREDLGSIKIPLIPLAEQQAIADFIDRETAKVDALAAKVREGMERLREYRAALTAAAVTGKVDVRGTAVHE